MRPTTSPSTSPSASPSASPAHTPQGERRVLAAVMPHLPLALAQRRRGLPRELAASSGEPPLVVLSGEEGIVLDASPEALALGVRLGESSAQANARAKVRFASVASLEVIEELEHIAEVLSDLAPTAAIAIVDTRRREAPSPAGDTVWLDVTGASHLSGGETSLASEVASRIAARSIEARVAIASGPRVAAAFARYEARYEARPSAGEEGEIERLARLPVEALVSDAEARAQLASLGVLTLGELSLLPRAGLSSRGGASVAAALDALDPRAPRRDRAALVPLRAPLRVIEAQRFDEPLAHRDSLRFVARSLLTRLAARLAARGEATGRLLARLTLDPSRVRWEARERAARGDLRPPASDVELELPLPSPLFEARALFSTLEVLLDRAELPTDVVAVSIEALDRARAEPIQLALTGQKSLDPARLPHLVAELRAALGPGNVGVFVRADAHPPERKARLTEAHPSLDPRSRVPRDPARPRVQVDAGASLTPTRLLAAPLPIASCEVGARVVVLGRAYEVERSREVLRMEGVEWWRAPISRVYRALRLVQLPSRERSEALAFVDPSSGRAFLHGWFE